jgi:general secretion pathway protein J
MKRRAPDGFTLLELLVALSLVSLMIAALVGGLRLGTRAWESSRISVSLDEAETVARAVAAQIERAFPAKLHRDNGPEVKAFDGGPDSLRFVALSEGDANWGGLMTLEIGGADEQRRQVLKAFTRVFREQEFNADRGAMRETRLIGDLAYLRLAYFGATDPRQKPQWRDDWREAALLPSLVALRIGLRRPNGVLEASATVALPQH